jgi:hypothetical protein
MKPEYVEEMKKLGVPWFCDQSEGIWSESGDVNIPIFTPETDSVEILEFATLAANNYHALKSAVEDLRDAAKEALGAWHGGTMNDVRAAMTLMEEALKDAEGLV